MAEQQIVYVFAWFQPDEWQKLKEAVDDPHTLDDCYLEWKKNAEKSIADFRANGQKIQKISINVSQLLDWCQSKGIPPNSEARAEYAALLGQQRNR